MKTTPVHQRMETPTETEIQEHVYQKSASYVHELKWHLIEIWSATSRSIDRSVTRLFYCVSRSQKQTLWTFAMMCSFLWYVTVMTFKVYTTAVMDKLTYVSFHKVEWEQPSGEVVSFVANLLKYLCAKNLWKYCKVWHSYCKNNKGAIFFATQCIFTMFY